MKNILTSSFKSIQQPRLNANLLAVVSLITLCSMTFLTVQPVFAWHCQQEINDVEDAKEQLADANQILSEAVDEWNNASGFWEKAKALARVVFATILVGLAGGLLMRAEDALDKCEKEHVIPPLSPISGGCDSGGCDDNG